MSMDRKLIVTGTTRMRYITELDDVNNRNIVTYPSKERAERVLKGSTGFHGANLLSEYELDKRFYYYLEAVPVTVTFDEWINDEEV